MSDDGLGSGGFDPELVAEELSRRFQRRLVYFAARRLRDPALAEDVAQEALRRVLEALRAGRIGNPEALPGYLFETARHVCQHRTRSHARETRALERIGSPSNASEDPSPLAALIDEERRAQVRLALAALPEDDQTVLRLSFLESVPMEQMARMLGALPATVRVRRHRALKRLEEILNVTLGKKRELS